MLVARPNWNGRGVWLGASKELKSEATAGSFACLTQAHHILACLTLVPQKHPRFGPLAPRYRQES